MNAKDLRRRVSLLAALRALGLGYPQEELQFHPTRRWRFDFAYPVQYLAIEIDGGQWVTGGGRHNGDADREKLNAAAVLGWRVLRFSGDMVDKDPTACAEVVQAALNFQEA